jgi:betaine-aldehyde dehydrogenase
VTEETFTRGPWTALELPGPDHAFVYASGDQARDIDPATGELVALIRQANAADVDEAVRRAAAAFASARWRNDGAVRARVLFRYAQRLREHADELAELLTREQGKTIGEARSEISGSADMVEYYAGLARAVYGRAVALSDTAHGVIVREPAGVVAVITPWNWPLTLLQRSLAPADRPSRLQARRGRPGPGGRPPRPRRTGGGRAGRRPHVPGGGHRSN